jgi:hypothetical protein
VPQRVPSAVLFGELATLIGADVSLVTWLRGHRVIFAKTGVTLCDNTFSDRVPSEHLECHGLSRLEHSARCRGAAKSERALRSPSSFCRNGGSPYPDILSDDFSILYHLLGKLYRLRIEQLSSRTHDSRTSPSSPRQRTSDPGLDLSDRIIFLRHLLPFAQGRVTALADTARHLKRAREPLPLPSQMQGVRYAELKTAQTREGEHHELSKRKRCCR